MFRYNEKICNKNHSKKKHLHHKSEQCFMQYYQFAFVKLLKRDKKGI